MNVFVFKKNEVDEVVGTSVSLDNGSKNEIKTIDLWIVLTFARSH